jgi:hypothetical protein
MRVERLKKELAVALKGGQQPMNSRNHGSWSRDRALWIEATTAGATTIPTKARPMRRSNNLSSWGKRPIALVQALRGYYFSELRKGKAILGYIPLPWSVRNGYLFGRL